MVLALLTSIKNAFAKTSDGINTMTIQSGVTSSPKIDLQIFVPAMVVIIGLLVPICLNSEVAGKAAGDLIGIITKQMGWLYLLGAFALFTFMLWLGMV
jgi:choline-glycine betaine transporter